MKIILIIIAAVSAIISVSGCGETYQKFDQNYYRTVALTGDTDTRGLFASYEVRRAKPGEGSLGAKIQITGTVGDGKQVISAGKPW